jgi:hypothetical protein
MSVINRFGSRPESRIVLVEPGEGKWRELSVAGSACVSSTRTRPKPRRLLKNPRMPRCRQFSEDRKEPSAGLMGCGVPISPQGRSATDKLGDTARAENWRNPGGKKGSHPFLGASSLGHLGRVRGPFPSRASLLSYSPLWGCSFVAPPIFTPKSSRGTCVSFSTVF